MGLALLDDDDVNEAITSSIGPGE